MRRERRAPGNSETIRRANHLGRTIGRHRIDGEFESTRIAIRGNVIQIQLSGEIKFLFDFI
jgi:hypothetical protein